MQSKLYAMLLTILIVNKLSELCKREYQLICFYKRFTIIILFGRGRNFLTFFYQSANAKDHINTSPSTTDLILAITLEES